MTMRCFEGQGWWRCRERRRVAAGWKRVVGFKISTKSGTTRPSRTYLDTNCTKFDTRYDKSDSEILKSQFQTINLVCHED